MAKKEVKLTVEQQIDWRAENEKWLRLSQILCAPSDEDAGNSDQWPFNYRVTATFIASDGVHRAEWPINAGSVWEARIFANRRIQGFCARTGVLLREASTVIERVE